MRLITTLSFLVVLGAAGAAAADQHHRPVVRDHRAGGHHGGYQPIVRNHGVQHSTPHYTGTHQVNRVAVHRRPLYHSNGRFTFHNGHTVVYNRPAYHHRHYDVRVRPQVLVENYPAQYGYVWVNGNWSWTGYEWSWTGGYYAPDASISTYYNDGSYDSY